MNCKYVLDLLPLYVGRDLDEKQMEQIAAHVRSCPACVGEAGEYRVTRELLARFDPPQFGDAVYAGVRRRVMDEIERGSARPALPRLIAGLFGRPIGRRRTRQRVSSTTITAPFSSS